LPVEAGVEVVGTVAKPEVHLISEPNVPDPDKLSWMVLGRPSDQMAGSEATLLMSAAGAIFGGDNGSNIPSSIAHSLGLEDLTFGTTSTSPESQLPTQTVAGTITSTAPVDQAFSIGKRIAPDIVFSIERSLTDASNGLKLTWQLTRRFSIIGRAGSDTAIDGQYTFTFE
jgi:translocation and assembly module TamB